MFVPSLPVSLQVFPQVSQLPRQGGTPRCCSFILVQFKGRNPASGFQVSAPGLLGRPSSLPRHPGPNNAGRSDLGPQPWHTRWQLSWEVMGHRKMKELRGIKQRGAGLGWSTPCCSAHPGSARVDGAAPGEVSWPGSVLRASGRRGADGFSKFELYTNESPAREMTPAGIKYGVPVPET